MDYSLYLTIEKVGIFKPQEKAFWYSENVFDNRNVYLSEDGEYLYQFGIIDYLQTWDYNKKIENFAKTVLLCKPGDGVSAVDPDLYSQRFYSFMYDNVFIWKQLSQIGTGFWNIGISF